MNKIVNLFILLIVITTGCNNNYTPKRLAKLQKQIDAIPIVVDSAVYRKDSLQIVNSIRWGFDHDTEFFNDYVRLGHQKSIDVNIYVDRIFYSPDTTKLFALIVLEKPTRFAENPNAIEKPENKYYYSGALILTSKKEKGNWVLYGNDMYRPMGWTYYNEIRYMFYNFFLNEILETKGSDLECAINQKCFWTDSNGFWRYGEIIPGYYNYEVNTHKDYFKATGIIVDSSNINEFIIKPLQTF